MIERAVSVHEDLLAMAANVFKLRHKLLEIAGGEGKQKPIAGKFELLIPYKRRQFALVAEGCAL